MVYQAGFTKWGYSREGQRMGSPRQKNSKDHSVHHRKSKKNIASTYSSNARANSAPKMTEACRSFFKDCVGPIANCHCCSC